MTTNWVWSCTRQRWTLPRFFLLQCDSTWSFSQDSEVFAFFRQSEPTNTRQRTSWLWQIMENQTNIWNSKFKILRTYSSEWNNCKIQKKSHLSAIHVKKKENTRDLVCRFINFVIDLVTHTTWVCTCEKRNVASTALTPTHGTVLELLCKVEGVGHKIFMDNYFTLLKLFSDLHVVQFITTGRRCHLISSLNIYSWKEEMFYPEYW
jgi:hypothetical protein